MNAKISLLNGSTEYYLYAYGANDNKISVDLPQPMIANTFAASGITNNNNTFLLAQPESNNSWTLLTYQLPKVFGDLDHGYNNFHVNTTSPSINGVISQAATNINITFHDIIYLSEGEDGLTVTVPLNASTFSQPGKQYSIYMEYDFVKTAAITGMYRMKSDLAKDKIPPPADFLDKCRRKIARWGRFKSSRLGLHPRYQIVDAGTHSETMLIAVDIGPPESEDDIDALGTIHYLNIAASIMDTDIDPNYGVVPLPG
ncbi:11788_t:CDS:2 [Acaulospora colombiana]|uniref:11788_t:CDS:1 n=1 Tax=Acaulospora colombiana TaxID=27376 RepID=A0ACA9N165_9GLOM|nr:11788_t:CDS:2 [Acaulospora colombiana]